MNVYTAALMARRGETIRIRPGIVIAQSDDEAWEEVRKGAMVAFPAAEGWADWQGVVSVIESPLILGDHQIIWTVTDVK